MKGEEEEETAVVTSGVVLCWFQEGLTLRNLWSLGCSVIVSYEHSVAGCHGDLWPHIPYWWANKSKAETLIEAFEHRKKQDRPGTPSIPDAVSPPVLGPACRNSLFPCFRGFLRDWNQPHRGPEVHLHTPDRVPEGPGDVHLLRAAGLGSGADPGVQGGLRQHHRRGLCHRETLCSHRRHAEREATETLLLTLHTFVWWEMPEDSLN